MLRAENSELIVHVILVSLSQYFIVNTVLERLFPVLSLLCLSRTCTLPTDACANTRFGLL